MDSDKKTINISISTATIFKVLIIILIIGFLYLIRDIVALIFISLILASSFDPWVAWLHRHKIPRGIGILLIYFILFSIFILAIILLIPPITNEISDISVNFPHYYQVVVQGIEKFRNFGNASGIPQLQDSLNKLSSTLTNAAGGIINTIFGVFGGLISFILVLVITFYFTIEEESLKHFIKSLTPISYQPYVTQLITRIRQKLGLWLRGQIILSLVIFILSFVGLMILDIKYALILAILAGIFEVVPYLGPIISGIPAVFFALTQSPIKALFVVILYFIIHQLENHIITPKIMGKTVDLNPLIIIIVLLVGIKLGGIIGAILAVPVATAASVFLRDIFENRKNQQI